MQVNKTETNCLIYFPIYNIYMYIILLKLAIWLCHLISCPDLDVTNIRNISCVLFEILITIYKLSRTSF